MRFVTYLRVSTKRQGESGLGLEAQRAAVAAHVVGRGDVVAEFIETESGKRNDRPQLAAAIAEAKRTGAVLLIAKLDRLARNVAFIANLLEGDVEVTAADMPEANRAMMQVYAVFAEVQGKAISESTKAALQAAKARGVKLGWSMPSRKAEQKAASKSGAAANARAADRYAENVLPVIAQIQASGITPLTGIAKALNARGIKTARGGKWYASTVRNIMAREFSRTVKGAA